MKKIIGTAAIVFFCGIISAAAFAEGNDSLIVNGDDLSCSRYNGEDYFYAELSGHYEIPGTIFEHGFSRFLFSNDCSQVDSLKGSTHKVEVSVRAIPYNATICERGGSWYCHQYGCYRYRVEYVDMVFPNSLKLTSEVHTPFEQAIRLHDGRCPSGN